MEWKSFWLLAYQYHWVDINEIKKAVITDTQVHGQITTTEFKEITGEDYTV